MKNTIKKLSLIVATAALFFIGAASVYAAEGVSHWHSSQSDAQHQRFLDIETGNQTARHPGVDRSKRPARVFGAGFFAPVVAT